MPCKTPWIVVCLVGFAVGCLPDAEPLEDIKCGLSADCSGLNSRCVDGYCVIQNEDIGNHSEDVGGDGPSDMVCDYLNGCLTDCALDQVECVDLDFPSCRNCVRDADCSDHCEYFSQPGSNWICGQECPLTDACETCKDSCSNTGAECDLACSGVCRR